VAIVRFGRGGNKLASSGGSNTRRRPHRACQLFRRTACRREVPDADRIILTAAGDEAGAIRSESGGIGVAVVACGRGHLVKFGTGQIGGGRVAAAGGEEAPAGRKGEPLNGVWGSAAAGPQPPPGQRADLPAPPKKAPPPHPRPRRWNER